MRIRPRTAPRRLRRTDFIPFRRNAFLLCLGMVLGLASPLHAAPVNSVRLILPAQAGPVVENIGQVVARQVQQRCDAKVAVDGDAALTVELAVAPGIGSEGYRIENRPGGGVRITGNDERGLVAGAGKFLRTSRYDQGGFTPGTWRGTSVPQKSRRGIYFATHFHNYYHEAPAEEIGRYVEDLALWGLNELVVWYDMHHFNGFDDPKAVEFRKRLHAVMTSAKLIGMDVSLLVIGNEGYANSPAALRATPGGGRGGYYPCAVCPSKPEGMKYILKILGEQFDWAADLKPRSVWIWPYDQGGCGCATCRPWGAKGFMACVEEVGKLARAKIPGVQIVLATWYMDQNELSSVMKQLSERKELADGLVNEGSVLPATSGLGAVDGQSGTVGAGVSRRGLPVVGFPEISMHGTFPWGGFGATPLTARAQGQWNAQKKNIDGAFPYSEGIYEDITKIVYSQFYWSDQPAAETVKEYIAFEFSPEAVADVASVVKTLEQNHHMRWWPGELEGVPLEMNWFPSKGVKPQADPGAEEAYSTMQKVDARLTPQAKKAWRWRQLYLRALLDSELKTNGGKPNDTCNEAFAELIKIYHAENAIGTVRPPLPKDWKGKNVLNSVAVGAEGRTVISMNGTWQIAESVSSNDIPARFDHTVALPGLVNQAKPAFPEVDLFASHYYFKRFTRKDHRAYPWGSSNVMLRAEDPLPVIGIPVNKRNYFWYRKTFAPPTKREVALLKIGKSQFGAKVWLNGKEVGEHLSCWTAGYFNLTEAMNWSGENQLIVRIGAHPAVLPKNIPGAGTYSSKHKWTPGIYDDVSLIFCDNPVLETIQVAPRIVSSEVIIQTKVRNYGPAKAFELAHSVSTWKEGKEVVRFKPLGDTIGKGEEKTYTQTNRIANARLWSPEDPFLYAVESRTGGDSLKTRFGMREYRFDSATKLGYLNGKPYYLRGGNIELHLYFEDPECGRRPWDRAWVKKLVADIPKRINWNAFRFCLSPVPDLWLEIADEEGILVQPEPIVWDWTGDAKALWSPDAFVAEYARWMRDLWNHPCVFMWDSSNETRWNALTNIVNRVRPLDLSNRAWDNSWTATAGQDDPTEAHPYLIGAVTHYADLRTLNGFAPDDAWKGWNRSPTGAGHPCIINEYAWLWLYPDGTPIDIAEPIYAKMPVAERQEFRFYVTAALTEMWRAQSRPIGIFDYVYFASYLPRTPGPYHFGDFVDPMNLKLHPEFERYMVDAFKPLGVYLKFWGDGEPGKELTRTPWFPIIGGGERKFEVVLVNDDQEPVSGRLVLSLEMLDGKVVASAEKQFRLEAVGKNRYELSVPVPKESGRYLLNATAHPDGSRHKGTTVSRRKVSVSPAGDSPAGPARGETKVNDSKAQNM